MFRVSIKESSVAKLGSVCRRVYRIFSHAYFHHRSIYDEFEVSDLYKIEIKSSLLTNQSQMALVYREIIMIVIIICYHAIKCLRNKRSIAGKKVMCQKMLVYIT